MGKPIVSKKKPIQIDGEALVPVVVQKSTGKKTIDPSVTTAAKARKKRVTFQEAPTPVMELELEDEQRDNQNDLPNNNNNEGDTFNYCYSDTWLTRRELDQIRFRVRKEVSIRRILEETQAQASSREQQQQQQQDSQTCWRGLETTHVTARVRKEHVQSVLNMAKRIGPSSMMAQFARQSSGKSGSTRAAYLRGKEDEEAAAKIHAELKRAQSLW